MKKILFFLMLGISFPWVLSAQTNPISGVVTSSVDGEALIGVSVMIKGSTIGTATDATGAFQLTANPNNVLVFSYLGYVTREIPVGNTRDFRVVLDEDQRTLSEVVVIGYGVQKKSLVSGAIAKVTSEDLNRTFPTRLEDVLNGKVSGLTVMTQNGQPNAGSDVYVRGIGTTVNAGPLYIVDGIQIDGNINFLNPSDIASVEVLKDAASAAIYGTRGANGVILVTTKTGTKGKTAFSYDVNMGWQNPWKKAEVLNAQEYMTLMNEMAINDGGSPRFSASDIANARTTDWQDAVFNYDAPVINHNFSVTGGNDLSTYAVSYGYLKQEGIVGGNYGKSNLERHNFRVNDSYTAFQTKTRNFLDKLTTGVNVGYTHQVDTSVDSNSEFGSPLGSALSFAPYLPIYASDPEATLASFPYAIKDKDGKVYTIPLAEDKYQEIGNPLAMLDDKRNSRINMQDVIVGQIWAELQVFKGLKFRSSYSIDMSFWGNDQYHLPYYIAPQGKHIDDLQHANISSEKNRRFYWQSENYFTYDNTFAEKHNVQLVLGQSASKSSRVSLYGLRSEPLYEEPSLMWLNNTSTNKTGYDVTGSTGDNVNFYSRASYFGRINYNFAERYMLSASYRRDGSSRFGPDSKWGNFPAVSVAWNILNEPFFGDIPYWMNAAKARVSWGRNGNDNIGELRYMTNYARGGAYDYYFGGGYDPGARNWTGTLIQGLQPGALENRVLKWEQSEQTNYGFDLLFLRRALNISFDYFTKKTIGMLQTSTVISPSAGQSAPIANVGDMSNKGIEFEIGYKGRTRDFNWYIDLNATHVKTILTKYGNISGIQTLQNQGNTGVGEYLRGKTGEVYPYFYGLKTDGIFQNWDEINNYTWTNPETGATNMLQPNAQPGDIRFVDFNGDGKISDEDKTKIGKPMPDWVFGLTLGANWKGFDVNFFFKSATGFDIFNYAQRGDVTTLNRPAWILDRWHGEGTSNTVPRMTARNPNGNFNSSDLYLEDGTYLRLKTAQLGYTLPTSLTQKIAVQKLRFYVSGYNLLTFTGYRGFDVEMGFHSVDRGVYPQSRTVAVGANVTF